jgi:hypothetical protein
VVDQLELKDLTGVENAAGEPQIGWRSVRLFG